MTLTSVEEVIDIAIDQELDSERYYRQLSKRVGNPSVARELLSLAEEEKRHYERLLDIKNGGAPATAKATIKGLNMAEYLSDVHPTAEMSWNEAVVLAMKREQKAARLYRDLADAFPEGAVRQTLLFLSNEEERHRLRFEREYEQFLSSH